jgi:ParB family chromosome partitioning protein
MNTMTLSETSAVATAMATTASGDERRIIPLSKLRPSKRRNVRRGGGMSIPELAASIARVRLIQNLAVVDAGDGEHFDVVAGRRRLSALRLLVKRRKLHKDAGVPCLVVADAEARTVSLTENLQREAMHPADQFEAFAALVAEGRPVEDIAADFGVTPLVVERRLKLANVSPRLLADYRGGQDVTLEQLMALAITDDHVAQEAAFYEAPDWQRSPDVLRAQLTRDEVLAATDALARLVGLDAYEAAGGAVRRDLFSEEQQRVYLVDAALLDQLARDKLADTVEAVRAEGWSWVDVVPRATYAELHLFQRARREHRVPSKAEAKRIAKLDAEQRALQDRLDDEEADLSEEDAQQLQDRLDALGDEHEAIERSLTVYAPEVIAQAGAVVAVDHAGAVVVHRGLLRAQPGGALRAKAVGVERGGVGSAEGDAKAAKPGLSEKLVRRLSAHRTAALQAEVARHPHIALVALVHQLARRVICHGYEGSTVNVMATSNVDGLIAAAPDIAEAPAAMGLREVREAWAEKLPDDSAAMFATLLAMPQGELISLLAVCVASTVGAFQSRESEAPASMLARALDLDMHAWWTPTAAGYFDHVSKAKALEAVSVFAPDQVTRLSKLKKGDLAAEAERLSVGKGWLPAMLCATPVGDLATEGASKEGGGCGESGDDSASDGE